MLPKLQRLKKHGEDAGLIFIVTTNYKERLDSAVVGRIDNEFLIPPNDGKSRKCLIYDFLTKGGDSAARRTDGRRKGLSDGTRGWVYKEIENLVGAFEREWKGKNLDSSTVPIARILERDFGLEQSTKERKRMEGERV